MLENIADLNNKMDEIEDEEDGSYDDEESDQDLDSELGDTLDVNDMNRNIIGDDKKSDAPRKNSVVVAGNSEIGSDGDLDEDDESSKPSKIGGVSSGIDGLEPIAETDKPMTPKQHASGNLTGTNAKSPMLVDIPEGNNMSPEPNLGGGTTKREPDTAGVRKSRAYRDDGRSNADQSSNMNSSQNRSKRSRKFRIRRHGDESSKMGETSSNYSGLMSRANTKKRSIRRGGGKGSISLAV